MPSSHLILCGPLLLLPPIPPSIRVFSYESTLCMRWPKYWNFSFSIIPSKEIPGLISFRMDWLALLAVQGTLKSLLQHHSSKASILGPYHSAIPLTGIHLGKTVIWKDTHAPMFIAALFTIPKTWKQLKCPLTGERIKKMWYTCARTRTHTHIHTMEYYSATKKNKIMPFAATWVDLEMIILSEVSQKEKDKHHMVALTCGI